MGGSAITFDFEKSTSRALLPDRNMVTGMWEATSCPRPILLIRLAVVLLVASPLEVGRGASWSVEPCEGNLSKSVNNSHGDKDVLVISLLEEAWASLSGISHRSVLRMKTGKE